MATEATPAPIPEDLSETLAGWLKDAGVDLRHEIAEWRMGVGGVPELVTTLVTLAQSPPDWARGHALRLLPDLSLGARTVAYGQAWAAPIRAAPRHAAECVSQLWYGARVRLLEKVPSGWWRVQGPDRYLGYVHESQLHVSHPCAAPDPMLAHRSPMTPKAPVALAQRVDAKGAPVGPPVPVPRGSRLEANREGHFRHQVLGQMALMDPDGLAPYPDPVLIDIGASTDTLPPGLGGGLLREAQAFLGVPYLWGGTTPMGLDCSGLVQLTGRLSGVLFPRDASQQATVGNGVSEADPDALAAGDLLFFGEVPGRYTHVALALGDGAGGYLHASGLVQVNSLTPGHPLFEPYRRQTWQGIVRLP